MDIALTSAPSCEVQSPHLALSHTVLNALVLFTTVLVQACEVPTLPAGICTKVIGFIFNTNYILMANTYLDAMEHTWLWILPTLSTGGEEEETST